MKEAWRYYPWKKKKLLNQINAVNVITIENFILLMSKDMMVAESVIVSDS
jgi:hypothetical protein